MTTDQSSDRAVVSLLLALLGGIVGAVAADVFAGAWVWVPPITAAIVIAAVVPRGALLRRERQGGTNWVRLVGTVLLAAYVVSAVWGSNRGWPLATLLLTAFSLWLACVLLIWQSMRQARQLHDVATGVAFLLVGVAALLVGVAFLLVGVAMLRGGDPLGGVAALLVGVAALLVGVADLRGGDPLGGVAILLVGVAFLLVGVANLRGGDRANVAARARAWLTARPQATVVDGRQEQSEDSEDSPRQQTAG